ncbi:MAG: T9SS type A sorting domain-containing protein [Candidatus Zixiibacteriota bacterium]|nr:MAG: T9SS type A sorting domain-containing protein [candidate division Zixibacteria bacterium]
MTKIKPTIFARLLVLAVCLLVISLNSSLAERPKTDTRTPTVAAVDNTTFIDANTIFMFVTNHGCFGRDLAGIFVSPYGYGTYYPYIDTSLIRSGVLANSPLYAAGCWLGGIDDATGDIVVAVSEYESEYWPGPMVGGSYDPNGLSDPLYRVYKLYKDSSKAHVNQDYIDYADHAAPEQGAPLNHRDDPLIRGDQTLWTVFNDANPDIHNKRGGGSAPLGVEVQMSAWASVAPGKNPAGETDTILHAAELNVQQFGSSNITVYAIAVDPLAVTGDMYQVTFEDSAYIDTVVTGNDTLFREYTYAWHLDNLTSNTRLLEFQKVNHLSEVVEGVAVSVIDNRPTGAFTNFEVVANASGPLEEAEAGAAEWAGFPVPTDENGEPLRPTANQQATGDGLWLFHTADNGGTSCDGTRASYDAFLARVTRDGGNLEDIAEYDYEMRFTGSNSSPHVNGSYAIEIYNDDNVFWVPFELWRTGIGTPDDPSDDIRLFPFIIDDYGENWEGDDKYELESWGTCLGGSFSGEYEHSVSGSDDDPFTDWVYWILPLDDSPGEAGYLAAEADMLAGTFPANVNDHYGAEVMARTVLVNWNGGVEPPFTQDCPEQGTVFRITTGKASPPPDMFLFTSCAPDYITTGAEGQSIYLSYKVINKGGKTLRDCYFSLWIDPDLGYADDDLVGCDTLTDLFYSYNGSEVDPRYGYLVPAIGFKYLYGPMVPSPGDSAYFDGTWIPGYRNLGLTAFSRYINGTDPDNWYDTYGYMRGLTKSGDPYVYEGDELTYMCSGDPVTGSGDVDYSPTELRMMGTCGPFSLNPGDSQYVLIKMAVAQGDGRLNSITKLREVLNADIDVKIPGPKDELTASTDKLAIKQVYPNPFNPSATIRYALPERAHVKVDIYNILGQRVARLVDQTQPAGLHSVVWDGTDESGNAASTGVYFCRVMAGDKQENRKMVLLK